MATAVETTKKSNKKKVEEVSEDNPIEETTDGKKKKKGKKAKTVEVGEAETQEELPAFDPEDKDWWKTLGDIVDYVRVVEITPELAEQFLVRNVQNRKVVKSLVSRYVDAINRDEWQLNGETIIFNENGEMQSGQHRCHAVIQAGKSITTLVAFNVPKMSNKTQDTGKPKAAHDILGFYHYQHPRILAATIAWIRYFEKGQYLAPTGAQALKLLEGEFKELKGLTPQVVAWTKEEGALKGVHVAIWLAFVWFVNHYRKDEKASEFVKKVITNDSLKARTPEKNLYNLIKANNEADAKYPRGTLILGIVKAFNAFAQGQEEMSRISIGREEPMPEIEGVEIDKKSKKTA